MFYFGMRPIFNINYHKLVNGIFQVNVLSTGSKIPITIFKDFEVEAKIILYCPVTTFLNFLFFKDIHDTSPFPRGVGTWNM